MTVQLDNTNGMTTEEIAEAVAEGRLNDYLRTSNSGKRVVDKSAEELLAELDGGEAA